MNLLHYKGIAWQQAAQDRVTWRIFEEGFLYCSGVKQARKKIDELLLFWVRFMIVCLKCRSPD